MVPYFTEGQSDIPKYSIPYPEMKVGDYVVDSEGIICRIGRVYSLKNYNGNLNIMAAPTKSGRAKCIMFGKAGRMWRVRKFSWLTGANLNRRLTTKEKLLIKAWIYTFDIERSYKMIYGLGKTPMKKIQQLLMLTGTKEYIMTEVQEYLRHKGVGDYKFYIDKLVDAVQGDIKTGTQLEILKILALASGDHNSSNLMTLESKPPGKLLPIQGAYREAAI